jgi:succinate dehydrogenase/fumarate reductase flavoprotein subunit
MSLHVTLGGESEAIIRAHLEQGNARSPEELIERALTAFSSAMQRRYSLGRSQKTPAEAVSDIRKLRSRVSLGGIRVKDLAHEDHRY